MVIFFTPSWESAWIRRVSWDDVPVANSSWLARQRAGTSPERFANGMAKRTQRFAKGISGGDLPSMNVTEEEETYSAESAGPLVPLALVTMPEPSISVVIPTLNEAANLPHVLARIPSMVTEVLLVDGHSTDDTIAVARAIRPDIRVVLQDEVGKGNALACGFAAASGDIIVMIDADGSNDPAEIPQFVEALLSGSDFAKGSRFTQGGDSTDITPLRKAGNRVLGLTVNVLFGTRYTDLCYGYNAFWSHCLPHMRITCAGFEVETLINVRVARAQLAVAEVPSVEHERLTGESNLHVVRDGLRILWAIVQERFPSRRQADRDPDAWRPAFAELHTTPADARRLCAASGS
jgi:hypothetical protein